MSYYLKCILQLRVFYLALLFVINIICDISYGNNHFYYYY